MSRRKSSTEKASPNQEVWVEITPEMRARADRAASKIIDVIMEETQGPFEALWVLRCVAESFMEKYDVVNMTQLKMPTRSVQ